MTKIKSRMFQVNSNNLEKINDFLSKSNLMKSFHFAEDDNKHIFVLFEIIQHGDDEE